MASLDAIGIEDGLFVGASPGFRGTIKRRPCDFVVNEIDVSGRLVEASSFDLPPPPVAPPPLPSASPSHQAGTRAAPAAQPKVSSTSTPTSTSKLVHHGVGRRDEDESRDGRLEQLRQLLGGSDSQLSRLAKLDAAARGTAVIESAAAEAADPPPTAGVGDSTVGGSAANAEGAGGGDVVRIPAGVDKVARAKVHHAVQEAFPFVKTATAKGVDGAATVVCSRAAPSPALIELLSAPDLEALQRMVNRGPHGEGADAGVTLSPDQDRSRRTLVHRAVAEAFPYLQTKTHNDRRDSASQRVSVFWSKRRGGAGGAGGKKRRRQGSDDPDSGGATGGRQQGGRPDGHGAPSVRFGLRKEGCEHNKTASALSKALHVPLSALSFGGIKDKVAITTQACVVKGVSPRKILETNGSIPGVTVGSLSYCGGGLSLGELSGNKFSVVVRGARVSAAAVDSAVQEVCLGGFVNFFGTQRVGSPSAAARGQPLPYQVGRDILAGDWEAAVANVLRPRVNDPPSLRSSLSDLLDGTISPKECAVRVKGSNRLSLERSVLQGLVRYGASAFHAAIQCVPYGMRTMWVHAYQSHVWNSMACSRIRLLGAEAVPGDLVLLDDPDDLVLLDDNATGTGSTDAVVAAPPSAADEKDDVLGTERSSSASGVHSAGRTSIPSYVGDGVVSCPAEMKTAAAAAAAGETNTPGADSRRSKGAVCVLTQEVVDAYASQGVTARDLLRRVVLPLAGTSVQYPHHGVRQMYQERLEKDGVHHLMWPERGLTGSPARAANVETAEGPPKPPSVEAVLTPSGSPGTEQSDSRSMEESGGGGSRKDSDNATSAPTSAVASSSASTLVPRGAYRRLLCFPTDVSSEAAAPSDGADGDTLEGTATESSAPCNRTERGSIGGSSDDNSGGVGSGGGERRKGGGGLVCRREAEDPEVQGGAGKAKGDWAVGLATNTATLPPVWDDVRLTFTLPPGSFATMFLREVMKANGDIAWGAKDAGDNGDGKSVRANEV
eukprot:g8649.t1